MLATKKNQNTGTLADKIASILTSAPANVDPEDDNIDATNAQVVKQNIDDHEEEEEEEILSKFRRDNINLLADLDEKYAGKKASRKDFRYSDSDDEGSEDDYSEESHTKGGRHESNVVRSDEAETDDEGEDGDTEDENSENWESLDENASTETDPNFKHISDINISHQVKKGVCVRNQTAMWENLLEIRIQLQKCLVAANKMPRASTLKEIKKESGQEFSNKHNETKTKLCDTLDKLLLLQKLLLKQFPETKKLDEESDSKKTSKNENDGNVDDEEIPSDSDNETSEGEILSSEEPQKKRMKTNDYEKDISRQHKIYKDYRNSVIQKWNDKTRVVLKGGATSHSVLDQIEYNLNNKDKLLKRTQLKRSQYSILGEEDRNDNIDKEEHDPDIFDDDDFYHQLLRELIEVKSADVTDPVQLGRQWIQLQNLRSKMKRKIDTRATKGRKIRYAVHSKLVNFMAPIEENSWTDEAKNELYSSLFGKNQLVYNI